MGDSKYDALKLENQICFPLYACSREIIKQYKPFLDKLDLTYTQYQSSTNRLSSSVDTNMYFTYHMSATIEPKGGAITSLSDATDLVLCVGMDALDLPGLAARLCIAAGAPFIGSDWDHSKAPDPTQQYSTLRRYSWGIRLLDGGFSRMITFPKFGTDIPYQEGGTD